MSSDWIAEQVRRELAAEARVARLEADWEAAGSRYRVAYYHAERHVVDEYGIRTGEVKMTATDQRHLAALQVIEARCWALLQAARADLAEIRGDLQ